MEQDPLRSSNLKLPVLDRRNFITALGGAAAVASMSGEAKADALEMHLNDALNSSKKTFPSVAEVNAQINTRPYRRGVGKLFAGQEGNVGYLPAMPANPTLIDFIRLRLDGSRDHCLQSAHLAKSRGMDEEVVLACLLHDLPMSLMRSEHGFWSAQLFEPYVSERTTFAIRHHASLRFFPDEDAGYEYPDLYRNMYGEDYVPPPHMQAEYKMVRAHRWYMAPRLVTVNDLYSFDPDVKVELGEFEDIIGRHFRQPKEGLGLDGSHVAHMWRTIANPDSPL
ncbi:hypothetical protein SLG_31280 [Sphingobium sp. SYK-6]|uniref:hypothetical protein n=1 Tax=Sphingobium sp. (strain NBRC 103272 / SYK-6) TaxID=627192 RepID=UPI000227759B|nr:hypothetical protein [Sphingobium sp. SYK-6]BAK67803.1 hypothetical protein SLG_31280 [Sphingobium sp. SYK-6]